MKRARNPKWSFVVMRGADKSVMQFHVSKRSVLAAPTAAVLAVSGCIVGLQIKSAYELRLMEEQLSGQTAHFTQTVSGKDEAIRALQQEVVELSRQAKELEAKVGELHELELKLKRFIDKYGSGVPQAQSYSTSPRSQSASAVRTLSVTPRLEDAAEARNALELARIANRTGLNLKELGRMVDTMEQSMELTLMRAEARRAAVDGYPSGWPTRSKLLTSGFGYRSDPFTGRAAFHAGIDITGKLGDPVYSAADGTVSETGYDGIYGRYVIIDHAGGLQTGYMHLKQIAANEGDAVAKGDKIGQLGSSGRSTGPHLHFQIMQKNEPVNPLKYLALVKED
ncbi:M23 family metallopeptidase [Paenibacillus arenilitoris]|uniref:Peptidoglycan DD-metalloendopeptidase family protein n=1 Tax=Paenibacillus arenilitoris TaxID=2772299 RepID=A0A927CLS0_9BACL|nr:M23 family metallopeptidase [Paenibacillus arenilitoris]MBD2867955.1 peptidoglycan DD-metalloendopeptidase family protein [Paenibacillus arenilitoris]